MQPRAGQRAVQTPDIDLAETDPAIAAAVRSALSAVGEEPRSGQTWGRLGMVLYIHELLAPALGSFAQAERFDEREPRWPYFQGLILKMENPDEAIPKLQRAALLAGDESDMPRVQLAELLQRQGRFDEARQEFERLIRESR